MDSSEEIVWIQAIGSFETRMQKIKKEELHKLLSSPNIVKVIKSTR
jgi:hypothetical protein